MNFLIQYWIGFFLSPSLICLLATHVIVYDLYSTAYAFTATIPNPRMALHGWKEANASCIEIEFVQYPPSTRNNVYLHTFFSCFKSKSLLMLNCTHHYRYVYLSFPRNRPDLASLSCSDTTHMSEEEEEKNNNHLNRTFSIL